MTRASPLTLWFGLVIAASLLLYHTSDRVEALNHQLRDIDTAINAERESIHVLKAEWAYLADPARIASASERHLPLRPTLPQQVITMNELTDVLPTRSEAMASVVINGMPIANIRSNFPQHLRLASTPESKQVAHADKNYLNNHMIMQRTTNVASLPTPMLIDDTGSHP
jgi:hypothetical protein